MNIGILGGGQLALMMAQAGSPLGLNFMFLCPDSHACAAALGTHICAPYEDAQAQERLAEFADVATYEFENVPLSALETLQKRVPIHPSPSVLAVARDRLTEKKRFSSLGIPTAKYAAVNSLRDLTHASIDIGLPAILKTRTQGYDGKGQALLSQETDLAPAWEQLGKLPCIVESKVPFSRELSIIAARDQKGEMVFYPISENYHRDGILRLSISRLKDALQVQANAMIKKFMEELNYIGVMALELFQVNDQLVANEFAPRVHNSGHWTIEATSASQFENHLRAICGLSLVKDISPKPAAMVNLIGNLPKEKEILEIVGAAPHFYGKAERPKRKVGHITLTGKDISIEELDSRLASLLQIAGEIDLANQKYFDATNLTQPT